MSEPNLPRNPDQDLPPRTGDEQGAREPLMPPPVPEPHERRPPEDEADDRDIDQNEGEKVTRRNAAASAGPHSSH